MRWTRLYGTTSVPQNNVLYGELNAHNSHIPLYLISGQENELADRINDGLSTKYYWRDWLIVVYPDMRGSPNHWRHHCDAGHMTATYWPTTANYIHWKGRYNMLVSSISSTTPSRRFTGTVRGYRSERYRYHFKGRYIIVFHIQSFVFYIYISISK